MVAHYVLINLFISVHAPIFNGNKLKLSLCVRFLVQLPQPPASDKQGICKNYELHA